MTKGQSLPNAITLKPNNATNAINAITLKPNNPTTLYYQLSVYDKNNKEDRTGIGEIVVKVKTP